MYWCIQVVFLITFSVFYSILFWFWFFLLKSGWAKRDQRPSNRKQHGAVTAAAAATTNEWYSSFKIRQDKPKTLLKCHEMDTTICFDWNMNSALRLVTPEYWKVRVRSKDVLVYAHSALVYYWVNGAENQRWERWRWQQEGGRCRQRRRNRFTFMNRVPILGISCFDALKWQNIYTILNWDLKPN